MKRSLFIAYILVLTHLFCAQLSAQKMNYEEIEWVQLMPKDDLDALMNPPDFFLEIEEGSDQDNIDALSANKNKDERAERFYNALKSTKVIDAFNDKDIKIPGFIVPLNSNEEQLVTEFFIVPYFGACLHLPPPPPNQIIYATSQRGVELIELSMPFWFEGNIFIETVDNDLGVASYSMRADNVFAYE